MNDDFGYTSASDFEFEAARAVSLATEPARKMDDQLHVQFYKHAELNAAASREANRKIFDEFVYVRIMAPANRLNVIERRATDDDKLRFGDRYRKFLAGLDQLASGTPIGELPTISPAQVMELRALKVETIEQLSTLPDTTAQLLGTGGQELKQRAIRFLDRTTDATKQGQMIRDLQSQLTALLAEREAERTTAASRPAEIKVTEGTQKA